MGLRGMSYNETQPVVTDPNEFAGKRIGILVSHCFEEVRRGTVVRPRSNLDAGR